MMSSIDPGTVYDNERRIYTPFGKEKLRELFRMLDSRGEGHLPWPEFISHLSHTSPELVNMKGTYSN